MDWNDLKSAHPLGWDAAFSRPYCVSSIQGTIDQPGMTLREYAAIHLMVPDSGNASLDKMILKALDMRKAKSAF
jgi:hypothetical protein